MKSKGGDEEKEELGGETQRKPNTIEKNKILRAKEKKRTKKNRMEQSGEEQNVGESNVIGYIGGEQSRADWSKKDGIEHIKRDRMEQNGVAISKMDRVGRYRQ